MPLTKIQSLGITDGTIVNADINASAAIAGTKLSGAGKVLQVVSTNKTVPFSSSSATFSDITGLSVSITPSSASNKILVLANVNGASADNSMIRLMRDSTSVGNGSIDGVRTPSCGGDFLIANSGQIRNSHISFLDSPSTTSSTTYKIQLRTDAAGVFEINKPTNNGNATSLPYTSSSITVIEIAA